MDAATQRRFDALEAEVRRLRGRQEGKARVTTRGRRGVAIVLALLLALVPLSIFAANPVFSDLGDAAAVHQGNIQAIGNAGITTGFEDTANPGQRTYNPKGLVTREEMASFLARTAGLGGNPPVANAQTAVTAGSATTATSATTAQSIATASISVVWGSFSGVANSATPSVVSCPLGNTAIGGGAKTDGQSWIQSFPVGATITGSNGTSGGATGWGALFYNSGSILTVYAICLNQK